MAYTIGTLEDTGSASQELCREYTAPYVTTGTVRHGPGDMKRLFGWVSELFLFAISLQSSRACASSSVNETVIEVPFEFIHGLITVQSIVNMAALDDARYGSRCWMPITSTNAPAFS